MASVQARRPQRWGPLSGVAFVVILVVSFFLASTPGSGDSGAKVIAWYANSSNKRAADIQTLLADVAVVFGLFFFGYLRDLMRATDLGRRLAPVMFGGAVVFAGGGLLSSGATWALTDVPKKLTPAAAQALNLVSNDLSGPLITIGVSVLTLASGIVFLKTRMLPQWVGWLSLVIGVAGVLGPIGFFAFMATGIWILILCYLLYRQEMAGVPPQVDLTEPSVQLPAAATGPQPVAQTAGAAGASPAFGPPKAPPETPPGTAPPGDRPDVESMP